MRYGVNALPHVLKKILECIGARRQNLSRLIRVEKLGCAGSRQVIPAASPNASTANKVRVYIKSSSSPRTTGTPLCCSSWVLGGIDSRRCAEALQTVSSWASPACTYLKQPWQPLQVFALSQSLFCLLLQRILT
jgi:hypothetical protein